MSDDYGEVQYKESNEGERREEGDGRLLSAALSSSSSSSFHSSVAASSSGAILPETVSSFYDQQYRTDADGFFDDQHNGTGTITDHNGNGNGNGNGNHNDFNTIDNDIDPSMSSSSFVPSIPAINDMDPTIEPISLTYDMGITKETKVLSRWSRRCCYNIFRCQCCRRPTEIGIDGDGLEDKPSNEELLSIAFASFLSFTVCQGMAAYFAQSDAMMGDSIAMAVDAFTYGFNLMAERKKNRADAEIRLQNDNDAHLHTHNNQQQYTPQEMERRYEREKRKLKLTLELVPPLISVITLIIVTGFILHKSISLLVIDAHRDVNMQARPNVIIMFVFSLVNLIVDIVNVMFFSKADHAFGYDTFDEHDMDIDLNESGNGGVGMGIRMGVGEDCFGDYSHDDCVNDDDNHDARRHHHMSGNGNRSRTNTGEGMHHPISRNPSNDGMTMPNHTTNNSNASKKGPGAKKQIADSLKHIMRERNRRTGGAYSHVIASDEDDDNDCDENGGDDGGADNGGDDDESYYSAEGHIELSSSKEEQQTHTNHAQDHDPSKFSIDDDDDENGEFDRNGSSATTEYETKQQKHHRDELSDGKYHSNRNHRSIENLNGSSSASALSSASPMDVQSQPEQYHTDSFQEDGGFGRGDGAAMRMLSMSFGESMDEEEAERQYAQYGVQKGKANLNMCSAYTHVFADTVRSVAVLIAAILGQFIEVVTPEVADAGAAIVVSAIILIALLPLLSGMVRTGCELYVIRREEASEKLMDSSSGVGVGVDGQHRLQAGATLA